MESTRSTCAAKAGQQDAGRSEDSIQLAMVTPVLVTEHNACLKPALFHVISFQLGATCTLLEVQSLWPQVNG